MDIEEALNMVLRENAVVGRHGWRKDFVYRCSQRMGDVSVHQWRCTRQLVDEDTRAEDWEVLGRLQ